jgi:hypothetical protein
LAFAGAEAGRAAGVSGSLRVVGVIAFLKGTKTFVSIRVYSWFWSGLGFQ